MKADDLISEHKYGKIFKATYLDKTVAVKSFTISTNNFLNFFKEESRILAKCKFLYVVEYIAEMQTEDCYQIIMEYCSKHSLDHVLYSKNFLPWNSLRWEIALNIGEGITFLHDKHVIHGDLKSQNVLLTENYKPKICDFGSARIKGDNQKKLTGFTTKYAAPELLQPPGIQTTYSDIYSYGIILWEIASRQKEFVELTVEKLKSLGYFTTEKREFPTDSPHGYQKWAIKCCAYEPSSRPLASEIIEGLTKEKKALEIDYYENNFKKKISFFPPSLSAEQTFQLGRSFRLNQRYQKAILYLNQAANEKYLPAYLDLYLISIHEKPIYLSQDEALLPKENYADMVSSNIEWFRKRCETENGEDFYNLARCYELGLQKKEFRERDPNKALFYLRLAADKNYAIAQYDLAEFYLKFDDYLKGHIRNLKEAEKYLMLAVNQNLALAQFCLGECYEKGTFGSTDKEKAIKYYDEAANNGHFMALIKLGLIYEKENKQNPNQKSLEKALTMYTLASTEGVEKSVKKVMFLSELMNAQKSENFMFLPLDDINLDFKNNESLNLSSLTV